MTFCACRPKPNAYHIPTEIIDQYFIRLLDISLTHFEINSMVGIHCTDVDHCEIEPVLADITVHHSLIMFFSVELYWFGHCHFIMLETAIA